MLKKRTAIRQVAVILLVAMCLAHFSLFAQARVLDNDYMLEERLPLDNHIDASQFIIRHAAYMHAEGHGRVSVWFDITGVGRMEEIGATKILLYERTSQSASWRLVRTYHYLQHDDMLATDTSFHGSHVSYNGVAGRSYYAVVHLWAGRNGGGDSRVRTTGIVVAI